MTKVTVVIAKAAARRAASGARTAHHVSTLSVLTALPGSPAQAVYQTQGTSPQQTANASLVTSSTSLYLNASNVTMPVRPVMASQTPTVLLAQMGTT
jgi:hypothetical protein